MFPFPLLPNPTLRDEVHVKLVPETGLVKLIALPGALLQRVLFVTLFTVAVGYTVIV